VLRRSRRLVPSMLGDSYLAIKLSLVLTTLLSFIIFLIAIRCPHCGKSLSWWAVSTQAKGSWVSAFFGLEQCPFCHGK
jgi:hypothetical protein